jgi:hypothetical protein
VQHAAIASVRDKLQRGHENRGNRRRRPWLSLAAEFYWRYRQVGNDVQVDLLSLSLSRDIPWVVKPIAGPIITTLGGSQ